jgi:peptidoglycan/xylan/chitin deacetylase (PgdA/CDA1 family)
MLTLLVGYLAALANPSKTIAITLDDLPGVPATELRAVEEMNRRVLGALKAKQVPAIGFVNEQKLQVEGERDERVVILRAWLEAGMTLGNHTFRHRSLSKTPLAAYEDDVLRGEVITRALMEERKLPLVYFRHPYTHTGPTAEVKQSFERFLTERGYKTAPFTIEHSDWMFAALYDQAGRDEKKAAAIRAAYLAHFDQMCAWFEKLAREMFGRDIPQILLTHVNRLNADTLAELLSHLQKRGYRFVTLDEALADDAYRTPDLYVGTNGPSWLHRWTVAKKLPMRMREEPDVPRDFFDAYQALQRATQPAGAGGARGAGR